MKEERAKQIVRGNNINDGRAYKASIIWKRGLIGLEERGLLPGTVDITQHEIIAEVAIWRRGWLNLFLRPSLVICYEADRPPRISRPSFREIILEVLQNSNLPELANGKEEYLLRLLKEKLRIWPIFGRRYSTITKRPVPHLVLFEWPAGRPFPD
jgi:hypothetical protein